MPDTLQILYTKAGTPYAKTRVLLPHDVPLLDYVALQMMKELLDDIRLGEEEAVAETRRQEYTAVREENPADAKGT